MLRPRSAPIVTLTTDFGTKDAYVAAMKAAVLRECPKARLIDVTHEVPRHDVLAGSIVLERAVTQFRGCGHVVHVCVVDPGVGTSRRIVATGLQLADDDFAHIVCPDNGLLTWTLRRHAAARAFVLSVPEPPTSSPVFHGRDVIAPIAGHLAGGASPDKLGIVEPHEPMLLDIYPVRPGDAGGRVIHIDHFGNCTTNVVAEAAEMAGELCISVAGRDLGPLRRTYGDVAAGEALALVGSSGLVEIAVREGSAAQALGLAIGDPVTARAK